MTWGQLNVNLVPDMVVKQQCHAMKHDNNIAYIQDPKNSHQVYEMLNY